MSVTIPPAIARHSFIRRYPNLNEIRHMIDSTGPHEGQSPADKRKKLSDYINRDTSHLLPKFRGPAEFKKEIARNALGKILATNPPVQVEQPLSVPLGGRGKRRRKTKRKRRKTKRKRRSRRRTRRKRARHRIKKEERNTHPAVMDEDKVIVDNKFLEKVVADIKKGEKILKKRKN